MDSHTADLWYVANLARYELVEAENEQDARKKGEALLQNIRTVRLADAGEIRLMRWHEQQERQERIYENHTPDSD